MKKARVFLLCILPAFFLMACQTVPVTGRRQLSLVSNAELNAMSFKQYNEFLSKNKVMQNSKETRQVRKVGSKIQTAVEQYFADNHMSSHLDGYEWKFNVVEEDAVNAWCMPGGKVVVYTGILPIAENETGLAVVIGHEIAHAVANHGNERMSQGLLLQMGGAALATALQNRPQQTRDLFLAAFGAGAQVGVLLPYSRMYESEADRLGLIFMAMAGYDPRAAVPFWQRMSNQKKGAPPEILSTHPSDATRIKNLKALILEAMQYYKPK